MCQRQLMSIDGIDMNAKVCRGNLNKRHNFEIIILYHAPFNTLTNCLKSILEVRMRFNIFPGIKIIFHTCKNNLRAEIK